MHSETQGRKDLLQRETDDIPSDSHEADSPEVERSLDVLVRGAQRLGIALADDQLRKFTRYYDELAEGNLRANLTSVTEWGLVQTRHFLDSLTAVEALGGRNLNADRMIDIGSGAGFPGVPLNIAYPGLRVTLMDSTGKKTAFLEHLIKVLELPNAQVVRGRAESVAHDPEHRERYDIAVVRAVARLPALVELSLPFLKTDGVLVAQKSAGIEQEAASANTAIETLGGGTRRIINVDIPELGVARSLVVVEKVGPTPAKYPRRPGVPAKNPL